MEEQEVLVDLLRDMLGKEKQYYPSKGQIAFNCYVCDEGTSPSCTNIVCSGNTLSFTVEHFDGYGASGDNAIPEFSDYLMMLALGIVGGGFFFIRKQDL